MPRYDKYDDYRYDQSMKGKPKKKKGGFVSFITTVLLIAAIGVFAFSAWKLVGYYMDYKAGTDEYSELAHKYTDATISDNKKKPAQTETAQTENETEEGKVLVDVAKLEDPKTLPLMCMNAKHEEAAENGEVKSLPVLKNPIDFAQLQGVNPDIIGWIRIGALDISYPVAQGADNDFYLHRTFEKQDNFAGCIFLNCDNSRFFTDQNSIVYGHNMKNGSMFGTLKKLQDQKLYDSNPYFWIFTPDLIYQYRIFATSTVSAVGDRYRIRFTQDDFMKSLQEWTASSYIKAENVTFKPTDRVVTLSTCTGDDSTRFVVHGVVEQIYLAEGSPLARN